MTLHPYMAAMGRIEAVLAVNQTLVSSDQLFAAVDELHGVLGDGELAEPLEGLRGEIQRAADSMRDLIAVGGFPALVGRVFLNHLIEKGLPPTRIGEDAVREALRALAERRPQDVGAQMEEGAADVYRRETIRGIGLMGWAAAAAVGGGTVPDAGSRETGPLDEDERVTVRPLRKTRDAEPDESEPAEAPADDSPLTDPETSRLLVDGEIFADGQKTPGPIVSHYRLGEKIGQGGCSRVYRGHEIGPNRDVAIKVVSLLNRKLREVLHQGFEREIALQGALSSDRFVHVYSTGKTTEGAPFVVMEYLSGGALQERISDDKSFDLKQRLALASQMVVAVAEAHARGIVHRDIKPDNYFLTEDGRAKLGDFGLAERVEKIIGAEPRADLFGTPGYIPPEEVNRASGFIPASPFQRDVFALGVSLYELFAGAFPFDAASVMATLIRSVNEEPPPPSQVNNDLEIPPSLDRIILKAMAKDPAARYENAQNLLHDLVTYEAQELEAQAEDILRRSAASEIDRRLLQDEWREKIVEALAEYRQVYKEYPSRKIEEKMAQLNFLLYRWASQIGDDETMRRAAERIRVLAPGSDMAQEVDRPISVIFELGAPLKRGVLPGLTLVRFVNRSGFLQPIQWGKTGHELPKEPIDLAWGAAYGLHFTAGGYASVFIPFPVRPGSYAIHIPVYRKEEIPPEFLVVPAGPAASRQGPGSYSERFENWRVVDHDLAVGPLITTQKYSDFLKYLVEEMTRKKTHADKIRQEILRRLPANWDPRVASHYIDGELINLDAPVTHITYESALEFLQYLSAKLSREMGQTVELRLPTLFEWKRIIRGNDPRPWPWGNAQPVFGVAGFRFSNPRAGGAVVALPNNAPGIWDVSPFSIPGGPSVPHVMGNTQKFLHRGSREEQRLVAKALGISEKDLGKKVFLVAGIPYNRSAALDPDILEHYSMTEVGPFGILPVLQLRRAEPTPSLNSLTGKP